MQGYACKVDTDKCIFWVQQCCLFYSTDTPHHAGGAVLQGVRCVIHYQIPASVDIYVHRSGRTARGSADGLAVALVAPKRGCALRSPSAGPNRLVYACCVHQSVQCLTIFLHGYLRLATLCEAHCCQVSWTSFTLCQTAFAHNCCVWSMQRSCSLLLQALDRPEPPPPFPLNAALLPACRQQCKAGRVRLDVILREREQSKAHAGRKSHLQTHYTRDLTLRACLSFASSGLVLAQSQ